MHTFSVMSAKLSFSQFYFYTEKLDDKHGKLFTAHPIFPKLTYLEQQVKKKTE